jgi:pimeloyl-ACP methyl ester carboxylesterase
LISLFSSFSLETHARIPRIWLKREQYKFLLAHALTFEGIARDIPVTHIHGQHDALLPVSALAATHVIEGSGHFLFIDKRKELLTLLAKI